MTTTMTMLGKTFTEYCVLYNGKQLDDEVYASTEDAEAFIADAALEGWTGLTVGRRRRQIITSHWMPV